VSSTPSTSEAFAEERESAPAETSSPGVAAPRATGVAASRARALRKLARLRRRWGFAVLLLPAVLVLAVDLLVRGGRIAALPGRYYGSYLGAFLESGLFWALLLFAAARRRGVFRFVAAGLFVVLATCAIGTQVYFHTAYATYLNLDATLFGTSVSQSVFGQLRADGQNVLTKLGPPLVAAIALILLARRVVRPRRGKASAALRVLAPAMIVGVFLIPCSYRKVQASTPDVIYFHAMGGLAKNLLGLGGGNGQVSVRPGLRSPPALPRLSPAQTAGSLPKKPARNVVFVLTESVRSDVACSAFTADCPTMPETNAAVPERIPLLQVRSNSSTTAIQLAVLWSGLEPTSSREALHSAPLLFDFAHAAGIDDAYWTSHHMMFANSRLWVQDLPTSHRVGATDLDPLADIDLGANDKYVTERVKKDILEMKEPFFAVIHFGNTHVPYMVDRSRSPFQPSEESKDEGKNEAYRNYYKNAVYLQDKSIGEMLRFLKAAPFADRTVILYTSDHGEAFREHGQLGHTGAVLDEEIHVPAWIDAPPGTLTDSERSTLEKQKNALIWHTDFTPTMLDLMGLWDDPGVAPYRAKMVGSSLLRPFGEDRPKMTLGLTNCSGIWGCAYKNWGVMRGPLKVEGREWYSGWRCFDVLSDPQEKTDLGAAKCGDLMEYANKLYGEPPSGK
jgi:glucan phosphoethanolaminetransferase (alkaline phosphatase superfamily)